MKTRNDIRYVLVSVALLGALSSPALAASGAWDPTYVPTISGGAVNAMALQPDGRLLIGGAFMSVNTSGYRYHLARLYPDGSPDPDFFSSGSGVSGTVFSLVLQADGRIVIGGDFNSVNGMNRARVARLNPNGTVDGSFVPTNALTGSVLALAAQSDNKVIIGGGFTGSSFPAWNARLNGDGTIDSDYSSYPNGAVNAIAVQPDGKIVIGGAFTAVNGATRYRIARLNADGSLDNAFQNGLAGASGIVRCLQIQPDGKILIGGEFSSVNNTTRPYIARLNSNGSLDTGFGYAQGGLNGPVYALLVQPDSCVVVGGSFSSYASYPVSRVARLYADGTRDTGFANAGVNNLVQALAVQADGAILIGGTFTSIGKTNRSYLARLYGNLYPPEFVREPVSRAASVGATVTFSALVNNPTPSNYQWRKDGSNIPGATGMSYTLYNVQLADAGNYSVFISNAAGGLTSSNALLQVGLAPTITQQPRSSTNALGTSNTFSVVASGTEPLSYQWLKDGLAIPFATNSLLALSKLQYSQAGSYSVKVVNVFGWVVSSNAQLTIPVVSLSSQGLVAYYPFNGNAHDESGNGNDGTPQGAVLTQDRFGAPNSAYDFNGIDSTITFASPPLTQVDNWTVSAWINPRAFGQVSVPVLVGFDNGSTGDGFGFGFQGDSTWEGLYSGVSWFSTGYTMPATNRWYHLVMLRDSGTARFFVDGAQTPSTSSITPRVPTRFTIGSQTGTGFFNGQVDDVRIYDRALSPGEVQLLYASELQLGMRLNARLTTDGVLLSFPAAANVAYSVLFTTDLTSGLWQKLADVPAQSTNSTMLVPDPAATSNSQRFYRLVTPPWP